MKHRFFRRLALLKEAVKASETAYCPYSRFRVGAALLAANGRVFRGANMENASYRLTVCAEHAAFLAALAESCRDFVAIAVVASGSRVPYPCGPCRQIMAEFCSPSFIVLAAPMDRLSRYEAFTLGDLLPQPFTLTRPGGGDGRHERGSSGGAATRPRQKA